MDTTISLSPDLQQKVEREARARGMTVSEFVRESLERAVSPEPSSEVKAASLFADNAVYRGECPSDLSTHHDSYLYGDES